MTHRHVAIMLTILLKVDLFEIRHEAIYGKRV